MSKSKNQPQATDELNKVQSNDDYVIKVELSEGEGHEPTYEEVMEHFGNVVKQTMTFSSSE